MQQECMYPRHVQNTQLTWTSECQQADWLKKTMRNSSHAAELAEAGSFLSYIRYTARIKANGGGREEEGAQGGKKEKPKWKEEGCVWD